MKKYLLLQFRTDKTLEHEVNCVKKALEVSDAEITVVNIFGSSKTYKDLDIQKYDALIIGASGQFNLTDLPVDREKQIDAISHEIKQAIQADMPVFAMCFGHQLVAKLMGGKVERTQAESGNAEISLNKEGKDSLIFKDMPERFWVVSAHKDSVTKLPKNAVKLAKSKITEVESYQIGNNVFCMQFHPELELDDLMFRLSLYPEYLQGKTLEEVRREYHETPFANQILKNFKKHVEKL